MWLASSQDLRQMCRFLEFEEAGVGVAAAGKVRQGGEPYGRGLARRFVFHQVAQCFYFLAVHGCLDPLSALAGDKCNPC